MYIRPGRMTKGKRKTAKKMESAEEDGEQVYAGMDCSIVKCNSAALKKVLLSV